MDAFHDLLGIIKNSALWRLYLHGADLAFAIVHRLDFAWWVLAKAGKASVRHHCAAGAATSTAAHPSAAEETMLHQSSSVEDSNADVSSCRPPP